MGVSFDGSRGSKGVVRGSNLKMAITPKPFILQSSARYLRNGRDAENQYMP